VTKKWVDLGFRDNFRIEWARTFTRASHDGPPPKFNPAYLLPQAKGKGAELLAWLDAVKRRGEIRFLKPYRDSCPEEDFIEVIAPVTLDASDVKDIDGLREG
jgi:hypothetical protein